MEICWKSLWGQSRALWNSCGFSTTSYFTSPSPTPDTLWIGGRCGILHNSHNTITKIHNKSHWMGHKSASLKEFHVTPWKTYIGYMYIVSNGIKLNMMDIQLHECNFIHSLKSDSSDTYIIKANSSKYCRHWEFPDQTKITQLAKYDMVMKFTKTVKTSNIHYSISQFQLSMQWMWCTDSIPNQTRSQFIIKIKNKFGFVGLQNTHKKIKIAA